MNYLKDQLQEYQPRLIGKTVPEFQQERFHAFFGISCLLYELLDPVHLVLVVMKTVLEKIEHGLKFDPGKMIISLSYFHQDVDKQIYEPVVCLGLRSLISADPALNVIAECPESREQKNEPQKT